MRVPPFSPTSSFQKLLPALSDLVEQSKSWLRDIRTQWSESPDQKRLRLYREALDQTPSPWGQILRSDLDRAARSFGRAFTQFDSTPKKVLPTLTMYDWQHVDRLSRQWGHVMNTANKQSYFSNDIVDTHAKADSARIHVALAVASNTWHAAGEKFSLANVGMALRSAHLVQQAIEMQHTASTIVPPEQLSPEVLAERYGVLCTWAQHLQSAVTSGMFAETPSVENNLKDEMAKLAKTIESHVPSSGVYVSRSPGQPESSGLNP